jgi:hypothetical protein
MAMGGSRCGGAHDPRADFRKCRRPWRRVEHPRRCVRRDQRGVAVRLIVAHAQAAEPRPGRQQQLAARVDRHGAGHDHNLADRHDSGAARREGRSFASRMVDARGLPGPGSAATLRIGARVPPREPPRTAAAAAGRRLADGRAGRSRARLACDDAVCHTRAARGGVSDSCAGPV